MPRTWLATLIPAPRAQHTDERPPVLIGQPALRYLRIRYVVTIAGFSRFHRASETPFNIVYEARP